MNSAPRTIEEVSDPYANFMLSPAVGPGVCPTCRTFHDPTYYQCYGCAHQPSFADVVVPITYSVGLEQMHHSLRRYKDGGTQDSRDRFTVQFAAVLWRFLRDHEPCVAAAAGAPTFDVVTVVPSGTVARDDARPRLRMIAGQIVGHTAGRFLRVLTPTDSPRPVHQYDPARFRALRPLDGRHALLIDDTWTSGASVQAAAHTLRQAGARHVGVVVIGGHINAEWGDNAERLRALPRPFRWETCAVHV